MNISKMKDPFKYRSYIYDEETAKHYLISRYYNVATSRFDNFDAVIKGEYSLVSNGYVYCKNNYPNLYDSDGREETGEVYTIAVRMWFSNTEYSKASVDAPYTGHFDMCIWEYENLHDEDWIFNNLVMSYDSQGFTVFEAKDSIEVYRDIYPNHCFDDIEVYYYEFTCDKATVIKALNAIKGCLGDCKTTDNRKIYKLTTSWAESNREEGRCCFSACALWAMWMGNRALQNIVDQNNSSNGWKSYTAQAFYENEFTVMEVNFSGR